MQLATNSSSSGSTSVDLTRSVFSSFLGWGVTTLLLWLLRRKQSGSDSVMSPDKLREDNTNQIGSPIPVVLGRAVIKDPLVSYYGDFTYKIYTEEYGLFSRFPWESIIPQILFAIISIVGQEAKVKTEVTGTAHTAGASVTTSEGGGQVTTNSAVDGKGIGTTVGSGAQNVKIVATVVSVLLTIFTWLLTRHMGRVTIQKGFKYYLGWQHIICWTGDNIGLKRIWMNVYDSEAEESTQSGVWDNDNHVAWKYENPNGIVAHIDDEDMFGGVDQGGGFVGDIRVYLGTREQPTDSWMVSEMSKSENIEDVLKGLTPKYSTFMTCVVPQAYIGKQVTIPSMWFEVVNYPNRLYKLHRYDLYSMYISRVNNYYVEVNTFILKQDANVVSYMQGYLNSLSNSVGEFSSYLNIFSSLAYTIDNSNSASEIARLNNLKVKNREEYDYMVIKHKSELADAKGKLDKLTAEASVSISNAQANLDDVTNLENIKVQSASDALDEAIASGDAEAIKIAQGRYDTAVLQANNSISLATENLNYTKQYYADLILAANDNIDSLNASYNTLFNQLDSEYKSYEDAIQAIEDDTANWKDKYDNAWNGVLSSLERLRQDLNALIQHYPEKEGQTFKDLTNPFVALLNHGIWHLGRLGNDINPAEAIYEILRNEYWGCAYDDSRIDIYSLLYLGVICEEEGIGISCLLNSTNTSGSVIEKILAHINGICYDDPRTGKLSFRLIRADYNVDELSTYDTSNCESLTFTRLDWGETTSNVSAKFIDADSKYDESSLIVYDSSNYRITHKVSEVNIDATYFTTPANARSYAQTSLLSLAYPLSTVSFVCNRSAYKLRLGEPIVITWLPYGISQKVYRVTDIDYGSLLSGKISVTAVEDVFGFELTNYTFGEDIGWTEPDDNPEIVSRYLFVECPYEITRSLDTFIYSFSVRPNYKTIYWDVWRFIGSKYTRVTKSSEFSMVAKLVYGVGEHYGVTETVEISALGADGASLIDNKISRIKAYPNVYNNMSTQNLIFIDDEIVSYNSIELLPNGHYLLRDVVRGVFDTIPAQHTSESVIYFMDRFQSVSGSIPVCAEGEVSDEQLEITTESATQSMDFDLDRVVSVTTSRRSECPSLMANLQLCSDYGYNLVYEYNFPATQVFSHDILFKFYSRNKFTTSAIMLHTDSSNIPLSSSIYNVVEVECNRVLFNLSYPATMSDDMPETSMRLKWADFCRGMGSRLALSNNVKLNIKTYDKHKDLYSYFAYNKALHYVVPTLVGIVDESKMSIVDYAKTVAQATLIVVPDSASTPQFTVPYDNGGIILSGVRVNLTDVIVGDKLLGQDGNYYDATALNAYRLCGLDNSGEPILYKITIDSDYVIQSHFTQKINNFIASYVWKGASGWAAFSPYSV